MAIRNRKGNHLAQVDWLIDWVLIVIPMILLINLGKRYVPVKHYMNIIVHNGGLEPPVVLL